MNFEMTGKLSISKETEKFKPWDERKYDSGWVKRRLLFNVTCGDNRHMLSYMMDHLKMVMEMFTHLRSQQ